MNRILALCIWSVLSGTLHAEDWYATHVQAGRNPDGQVTWTEIVIENRTPAAQPFAIEAWLHDGSRTVEVTGPRSVDPGAIARLRIESETPIESWIRISGEAGLRVTMRRNLLSGDQLTVYPQFVFTGAQIHGRYRIQMPRGGPGIMYALNPFGQPRELEICQGLWIVKCYAYTVPPRAVWRFRPRLNSGAVIAPAMPVGNMLPGPEGSTARFDVDSSVRFGEVR